MPEARPHFHDELRGLEESALEGFDMVVDSLERTLAALSDEDVALAERVIAEDDRIDERYLQVHQGVLSLIARQTPVAGDLRVIAALLDVIRHVERMGDQCVNIAKLIPLAGPSPAEDGGMLGLVLDMGARAGSLVATARQAFERRDVMLAEELVRLDDEIDKLNRESFPLAMRLADDPSALEWAMRMVQVSRWLERVGDHAVDVGEQTAFVVTGLFREFTDASHPSGNPSP